MDGETIKRIAGRVALSGSVRTAGKIEFIRDQGPIRRDIRVQGFDWSPDALRNLAKILWAVQRSHSYALAAYRLFSKMPSSQFSPDGLLGGRGYIQSVKDMRNTLGSAVETLSSFTDTVHDEINADHWASAEEGSPEAEEIDGIVEGAVDVKKNPEEFVENEYREESGEDDGFNEPVQNPDPDDYNPSVEENEDADGEEDDDESPQYQMASYSDAAIAEEVLGVKEESDSGRPGSKLPNDARDQGQGRSAPELVMNTTSPPSGTYAASISRILKRHGAMAEVARLPRTANSSLPVHTLPGPRVDCIGPAGGNDAGHFSDESVWPSDDPFGAGMSSGTNSTVPVYEDWASDGVTGYDNSTDGDSSVLQISSRVSATYSWLPGSLNEKNLDYYARGLSDEDIEYMHAHAAPDPPPGIGPKLVRPNTSHLWNQER